MNLSSIEKKRAYKRYLKSPHWLSIRESALDRDGRKCRYCGGTDLLHVHHTVYRETFEQTVLDDVETLCRRCHWRQHATGTQKLDMKIRQLMGLIDYGKPLTIQDAEVLVGIAVETGGDYAVKSVTALFRFSSEFRIKTNQRQRWVVALRDNRELRSRFWNWSYEKFQRIAGRIAKPEGET